MNYVIVHVYIIGESNAIQSIAMAQAIGAKTAAKSLAAAHGKNAMRKLMNGEPVDINDIFKAVLTDGPNAYHANPSDILKLVQDERAPPHDSLIYDTFDYIQQHLTMRKVEWNDLLLNQSNGLKPEEIEAIHNENAYCTMRDVDLMELKKILRFHFKWYTRQSIIHWMRLVFLNHWKTATMATKHNDYTHVLETKQPTSGRTSNAKQPKSPKKPKKPKMRRTTREEREYAQKITDEVFELICWYYNYRKDGCVFGKNCSKKHICSVEGCGGNHPATKHK